MDIFDAIARERVRLKAMLQSLTRDRDQERTKAMLYDLDVTERVVRQYSCGIDRQPALWFWA